MSSLRRAIPIAGLVLGGLALTALWTFTLIGIVERMSITGRLTGLGFLLAATAMFVAALVAAVTRRPRDRDRAADHVPYRRPRRVSARAGRTETRTTSVVSLTGAASERGKTESVPPRR
jgi:hypothetical protein